MTDFPLHFYGKRMSSIMHSANSASCAGIGKWYLENHALVEQGSWNYLVCLEAVKEDTGLSVSDFIPDFQLSSRAAM